jgi:hypothetical protein
MYILLTSGTKTEENEEVMKADHDWEDEDSIVQNLTCILVTGIQDPVRDEVSLAAGHSHTSCCFDKTLPLVLFFIALFMAGAL